MQPYQCRDCQAGGKCHKWKQWYESFQAVAAYVKKTGKLPPIKHEEEDKKEEEEEDKEEEEEEDKEE